MGSIEFTALIFVGSLLAGFLGALTGLGGGVVVVPLLAVVFRVDIHYAIGAALVSVIATSSGAAAAYVREGYSNIRVGMFLEMATTVGALAGAALVLYLHASVIAVGLPRGLAWTVHIRPAPASRATTYVECRWASC
jgi:uncharacterized membrane protein YfcA